MWPLPNYCGHLLQVVQLLQSFSLYTEQLDRSTPVKPDAENRMWLLTADRIPYSEGVVSLRHIYFDMSKPLRLYES